MVPILSGRSIHLNFRNFYTDVCPNNYRANLRPDRVLVGPGQVHEPGGGAGVRPYRQDPRASAQARP
jgi:hypothetical protein